MLKVRTPPIVHNVNYVLGAVLETNDDNVCST